VTMSLAVEMAELGEKSSEGFSNLFKHDGKKFSSFYFSLILGFFFFLVYLVNSCFSFLVLVTYVYVGYKIIELSDLSVVRY
jgi:hypothetical protein